MKTFYAYLANGNSKTFGFENIPTAIDDFFDSGYNTKDKIEIYSYKAANSDVQVSKYSLAISEADMSKMFDKMKKQRDGMIKKLATKAAICLILLLSTSLFAKEPKNWITAIVNNQGQDENFNSKESNPNHLDFESLYKSCSRVARVVNGNIIVAIHPDIKDAVLVQRSMRDIDEGYKGVEWKWFVYEKGRWVDVALYIGEIPDYNQALSMIYKIDPQWKYEYYPISYDYPYDWMADAVTTEVIPDADNFVWKQKFVGDTTKGLNGFNVNNLKDLPVNAQNISFSGNYVYWRELKTKKNK